MPIRNVRFSVRADDDPPRPWLPIRITNPYSGLSIYERGLVDTGSDKCSLPFWVASLVEHDLEKGESRSTDGHGGKIDTYLHTTIIDILDDSKKILHSTDICLIEYADVPCILLGVERFLELYCLEVKYPDRIFSVYTDKLRVSAP